MCVATPHQPDLLAPQFPKNTHSRELEKIFMRYDGFQRLEHNVKWAYVDFFNEHFAQIAMEELNSRTNLIVSYAKPGAGEIRAQQRINQDVALAIQHAARTGRGYMDDYKRMSPLLGMDDYR